MLYNETWEGQIEHIKSIRIKNVPSSAHQQHHRLPLGSYTLVFMIVAKKNTVGTEKYVARGDSIT